MRVSDPFKVTSETGDRITHSANEQSRLVLLEVASLVQAEEDLDVATKSAIVHRRLSLPCDEAHLGAVLARDGRVIKDVGSAAGREQD